MRLFTWAPAVMALAAMAQDQQDQPDQQQQIPTFEVDIISPRNTSYRNTEALPIVIAVQNITALRAVEGFKILWSIMGYRYGWSPGGLSYDEGYFEIPPAASDSKTDAGTTILVDYTDTTKWIDRKQDPDWRFALQWYIQSPEHDERCGDDALDAYASKNFFNIVTEHEERVWGFEGELRDPGVTTECPDLGGVVEVRNNATDASCKIVKLLEDQPGKPCEVKVDQAAVTSIASKVASMSAPTPTTSATETTSTSTAGVGPARTIQTALAAAVVLGGLAL